MRPRSMNTAVLAIVSATLTDCSTSTTVVPSSATRRTISASWPTMTGARPMLSSSISSSRGRDSSAMPSASICCWPPDRLAAGSSIRSASAGKTVSTSSMRDASSLRSLRTSHPAARRFSATVSDGKVPSPPGHLGDAERRDLVRRRVGDVAAVQDHRTEVGLGDARDRAQQGRLARAVGPQQREDLALGHLQVDVEQHLHRPVADLQVLDDQQLRAAVVPVDECLRAGQRRTPCVVDVALDHRAARRDDQATDGQDRHHHQHAEADAEAVRHPADQRQHHQAGDRPPRSDREADRARPGRDRQRQRREEPGQQDREHGRERDVRDHGEPQGRRQREARDQPGAASAPHHAAGGRSAQDPGGTAGCRAVRRAPDRGTGTARRPRPGSHAAARRGRTPLRRAGPPAR